jgi:hypothetical protein
MQKETATQLLAFIIASAVSVGCAGGASYGKPVTQTKSFVVLALSRGTGVPKTAQEFLKKAQTLLDKEKENGADIAISRYRIGLEGETKLCAEFSDPQLGGRLLAQIQDLSRGIDLINVLVESCDASPELR